MGSQLLNRRSGQVYRTEGATPVKGTVLLIQKLCTVCVAPQMLLSKELCWSGLG